LSSEAKSALMDFVRVASSLMGVCRVHGVYSVTANGI
jgi:hypothetical protein